MTKFKKGQKCRIVENLLAPKCIGMEVTILGVAGDKGGRVFYRIDEDGIQGYASESCLEPIE